MIFEKINYKYIKNNNKNTLLLFLHGWGCDMRSFKYFERSFCSNFSILTCDLYGFGKSELPTKDFDVYDYAKNLYMLVNNFKWDKIVIICHSFGFRLATILSSCFDLRIDKLIVTGGAGIKPRFNLKIKLKVLLYKMIFKKNIKIRNKLGSNDFKNSNSNLKNVLVKVVNQHLDYLVKKIFVNTLLIWGNVDKETPLYMAKKINKYITNSKLKIIKGGHFAYLENKIYFEKICDFFLDIKTE